MRRPDSSSCLLLPKASSEEQNDDQLSVTVITTNRLPTYSAERYYVLNEIEQHAYTIQNLDDITSNHINNDNNNNDDDDKISSYIIFYLLWNKNDVNDDPNTYVNDTLTPAITALYEYITSSSSSNSYHPNVYVVLDKLSSPHDDNNKNKTEAVSEEEHHVNEIKLSEYLVSTVAKSSKLRSMIQGITIGIANSNSSSRPPTSCELLLSTVSYASSTRRRLSNKINTTNTTDKNEIKKSLISVIAQHPDDLLGISSGGSSSNSITESDADNSSNTNNDIIEDSHGLKNVIQSSTCAEWNGNGTILNFAQRAQLSWKQQYVFVSTTNNDNSSDESTNDNQNKKRKDVNNHDDDPMLIFMMISFWICVISFLWFHYSSHIMSLSSYVLKLLRTYVLRYG